MKLYRHIFFDLDRTLYDFDRNNRETIHSLYLKFGLMQLGAPDFEAFYQTYNLINRPLWDRYKKQEISKEYLNISRFAETLKAFNIDHGIAGKFASEYIRLSPLQKNLLPGTMEILNYLFKKYALHIITNGFSEIQFKKISGTGIGHFFQHIIVSEDAGAQKPEKRIFEFALNKTGAIADESILIGDDPQTDILGAQMAGIDQVWMAQPNETSQYRATFQIGHLLELKNIL
ncbi:MAG TPA: YjjG family noncanonical pyrimidine nucleotidase [Bacteroidales bacterium]|nr:YjjG family noncanonical pyrimidine nucleotidase [Bacteroidales bacterium]